MDMGPLTMGLLAIRAMVLVIMDIPTDIRGEERSGIVPTTGIISSIFGKNINLKYV